jgi:uncharacterized protein (DUF433 family)
MHNRQRIVRDPGVAEGATTAEITADFPILSEEGVRAAIACAAVSAQEDLPPAKLPVKQ